MERLAARNGGRVGLAVLAAILLLGLALRADYAWEGRAPVFDAAAYGEIAANLAAGEGFSLGASGTQPASNYSPGLPLLVAGLYELSGGDPERLARLVLAVIGALAVLFAYLIGRRLAGPAAGIVAALVVAVYPALLEYQGMLMSEPLAATLLSGAVVAFLWAGGEPTVRWLLPGLLLGGLALVRPEYLSVALLLVLLVAASGLREGWRGAAMNAILMAAGVAVVVAPWTVRNAVVLDRFVPVSTGGGQVLFAGSYLPSEGDPERVGREVLERHPGLTRGLAGEFPAHVTGNSPTEAVLARFRLEQILAALAAQRYPGVETDRALTRMGRERIWDAVSEQPLEYAGFLAAKLWRVWGHGPREVMKRPGWEIFHWAIVGLALLGLAALLRARRREAVPLLVILLAITAVGLLLVASPRRFLVVLPLVAALAGAGALWLSAAIPSHAPARGRAARRG